MLGRRHDHVCECRTDVPRPSPSRRRGIRSQSRRSAHEYDDNHSIIYQYHLDAADAEDHPQSGTALLPLSNAAALLALLLGDAFDRTQTLSLS
jgi:hypothetical protein